MGEPIRNILIIGGGFGGLEAALYLRNELGDTVNLTLLSDKSEFIFRPYLSYVPFGLWPDRLRIDLVAFCETQGIRFVHDRADTIHPTEKRVLVGDQDLTYDVLMIATGAGIGPESVPGLYEYAYLPWRTSEAMILQGALERLASDCKKGTRKQVVFLVPPGNLWAGPLYEIAFMFEQWLRVQAIRPQVRVQFLTYQDTVMPDFGPDVHQVIVDAFSKRHVRVQTSQFFKHVQEGKIELADGETVAFDLLIAAPTYVPTVKWKDLPTDASGFLKTEMLTRQVKNFPNVYVVGDASEYPIKQAYLALLQADAAAEHIVSRVQGRDPRFSFEAMGVWLMEQLDQALLATVPFEEKQAVPVSGNADYYVGKIPVGEQRRLYIRAHLPWRFDAANPLYAGLMWKGTETGIKVLSYLAREEPDSN